MHTDRKIAIRIICVYLCASAALFSGCAKPNAANIELRKQNQALRGEISDLKSRHDADVATIHGLQSNAPPIPTLPEDRLDKLFTVHGLKFGRLTGGLDSDPKQPGDEGLEIYVVPTDANDDPLKAAGSFVVEAFDLAETSDTHIGKWEFSVEEARKHWYGQAMLYTYALACPWQHGPPKHAAVTVKVTFTDELTGRRFERQKVLKINLPAAGSPGQ